MTKRAVHRLIRIEADQSGQLPSRIHLMSAGHWHTPYHGAFEMTPKDLADMVINFEGGVGLVEGSNKAPVNYGHDITGKAAGWIVRLSLENNGTELWGDVEWTPQGEQMLTDGEFRYISPEWNPRDFPWENPEVEGELVENVFSGAGLTNIPLFKKLTPVMASAVTGEGDNNKQGGRMDLETVRAKKLEELTDDEKAFLAEHQAELTDEERKAFGLQEAEGEEDSGEGESDDDNEGDADADADADVEGEAEGGQPKQASVTGALTKEQIEQLQADAKAGREAQQELLKTRLTASVKTHVDRGAIKSDQLDEAVQILMASSEAQRDRLTKFLAALPENEVVTADETGTGKDGSTVALTEAEKLYASDFNLSEDDLLEFKKSKEGKE